MIYPKIHNLQMVNEGLQVRTSDHFSDPLMPRAFRSAMLLTGYFCVQSCHSGLPPTGTWERFYIILP